MNKEEVENPEIQLYEHTVVSTEIVCDFCSTKRTLYGDDDDAIKHFYSIGWRGRTKCYCPDCAKKKLKKTI